MKLHRHYCQFHLGDCLIHLHFLRHLALIHPDDKFAMAVHPCYSAQLSESISDAPNVELVDIEKLEPLGNWRNVWKNTGEFWSRHPDRANYAKFYIDWFRALSKEMGYESPFKWEYELLFDYPALTPRSNSADRHDFMLCNSQPCSGQLKSYTGPLYFLPLIERIARAQKTVVITDPIPDWYGPCTRETEMSISTIGRISTSCKAIVGICNGPMWPCLNVHNFNKPTFIIMDHVLGEESVTGLKSNMIQVKTMDQLIAAIEAKGLL